MHTLHSIHMRVLKKVYIYIYVCVCILDSQVTFWCKHAGGSPTDLTGDPTKRVKLRADIWPDQPNVPAVSISFWAVVLATTRSTAFAPVLLPAVTQIESCSLRLIELGGVDVFLFSFFC